MLIQINDSTIKRINNYQAKTFHFIGPTLDFITIFARNFGLTSGENREC